MKTLRCALLLGLFCGGCRTLEPDVPGPAVKPAGMSDKDYVMAQLEELGCAGGRGRATRALMRRTNRTMPERDYVRAPSLLVPGVFRAPVSATVQTTSAEVSPAPVSSSRPTYVQKLGNTFYGPNGTAGWQSGRVMINSDGTTGTLIGNTLISQ
ncbi:MAG: hypothetical protein FGM15_11490 [Chthoniobacterales bacterium]|nr:hypothetical protein [Chthoniobacterales bacterium]